MTRGTMTDDGFDMIGLTDADERGGDAVDDPPDRPSGR